MEVDQNGLMDDPSTEIDIPYMNNSAESSEPSFEEILLGNDIVEIPSDLYENADLFSEFFSIDTWNDLLSEEVKLGLLKYLPSFPTDDIDEKAKTIEMLFGGENFHFVNPLTKFRQDLLAGDYYPENADMKGMVRTAQRRNFDEWLENYQFEIAQKCLNSRKKHLEAATGNLVTVPKIEKKRGQKGGNVGMKIRKRYLEEISRIKREIGEEGFSSDDEEYICPKVEEYQPPPVVKMEEVKPEVVEAVPLTQDMQPCFFSLLRDIFSGSQERRLRLGQLEAGVKAWQESPIAPLNPWYSDSPDWRALTHSALGFLSGSFPDQAPPDFQPLISVEAANPGLYQWTCEEDRETELALAQLTACWLDRLDSCWAGLAGSDWPGPGNVSRWVVRPSTGEERENYQAQERRRYSDPSQPFTWQCQDYTAVVAPVRSPGAGVRPHVMLVDQRHRPPAVTILSLVRDAVSRLPNGEGTRADIVELLQDSQFLQPNIETASLTSTVSGALDRLQNETDAPVKYDNNRKIWVYLHRARTLQELSVAPEDGNVKFQRQRQKRKGKVESDAAALQSTGTGEMFPGSILETALAGLQDSTSPVRAGPLSPNKTVQKIIVKGPDGKVIPLSSSTLQKLIEAGAIKPGTQIATPEFNPDAGASSGNIRILQHPNKTLQQPAGLASPTLQSGANTLPGQHILISPEEFTQLQANGKLSL